MKNTQIKYRQWMGTEWRYWGFIDGIFVAPIQGIEDSYQLLPFPDKNGNEIWEGDIIQYDWDEQDNCDRFDGNRFDNSVAKELREIVSIEIQYLDRNSTINTYTSAVMYDEQRAQFVLDDGDRDPLFFAENIKVIGNIKENPELLEKALNK